MNVSSLPSTSASTHSLLHLQVSLSTNDEGDLHEVHYHCQCVSFCTINDCVHVQLFKMRAAEIGAMEFPENAITPFHNGLGNLSGYYVPHQGILCDESAVLCQANGGWRCCHPEHNNTCLHTQSIKEHLQLHGRAFHANGSDRKRVMPIEEFLAMVKSDAGQWHYFLHASSVTICLSLYFLHTCIHLSLQVKLDSLITEPAFAPVRVPSTPDATFLGNMEDLLRRGHSQFHHNRTLFLDRLLVEHGQDCRHGDVWSGVDHDADFLAPLHHGHCPQCDSGVMKPMTVSNKFTVYLPAPHRAKTYVLFALMCQNSGCGHVLYYDGHGDGIFIASREIGVSLYLLYKSHDDFLSGLSLKATRDRIAADYDTYAPPLKKGQFISETAWRYVFYKFAYALRDDNGFCCDICGDSPEVIIADGTAITINKDSFFGTPVTTCAEGDVLKSSTHRRPQRCFLKAGLGDKGTLVALLKKLSDVLNDDPSAEAFTVENWQRLHAVAEPYKMKEFLEWVQGSSGTWPPLARKTVASFLWKHLATDSLVLAYCPYTVAVMFRTILQSDSASRNGTEATGHRLTQSMIDQCKKWSPMLYSVITLSQGDGDFVTIGKNIENLLTRIVDRAMECVVGTGIDKAPLLETPCMATADDLDECIRSGILCGIPQLRQRPAFDIDVRNWEEAGTKTGCRKRFDGGGGKTGGIFTVFCRHGVCLAAMMMPNAEGRNELFSWMVKYLKVPPKVIVYDYACSLHEYCINRVPDWFKSTLFLVDRLHWFNHKSCCSSYNVNIYLWLSHINTVICEQNNSALGRIERTISRSGQGSFMILIRRFLWRWNAMKQSALQQLTSWRELEGVYAVQSGDRDLEEIFTVDGRQQNGENMDDDDDDVDGNGGE